MSVLDPRAGHARRPLWRSSWFALGLFTLLTIALTWPLVSVLSSRVPGSATWAFDESTYVWNIWYFRHALLDLHASPLHSSLIWYPLGIDLVLYTYNVFNALIALPLQVAISLPLSSNVTLLLATLLSGFGAYLLVLYLLTANQAGSSRTTPAVANLAALLAGIIYAFGSNRAVYTALGHYSLMTTQWLPLYALYLVRTLRRGRPHDAALAGLFFALAALSEMIFASFLGVLTLIVVLSLRKELPGWRRATRGLAIMGAVAVVAWSPVLLPIGREFVAGNYSLSGWGDGVRLSADLAGLVTPSSLNPVLNAQSAAGAAEGAGAPSWPASLRAVAEGRSRFSDVNTVFLGYATLALALVGAWTGRRWLRPWIWVALVSTVLALGPLLQINGRYRFSLDNLLPEGVTLPLPYALLHFVPFVNANRAPNRYSVIVMLGLAVLAGGGAAWLLQRTSRWAGGSGHSRSPAAPAPRYRAALFAAALLLAGLLIAEHLAIPLPTTDARVPAIYQQIAAEPGDFAVLQLPLGWRDSFGTLGSELTLLQYYQTAYGKPMIGGNISREPPFKMEYFRRIPLFQALTDLEMYRPVPPDVDAAARAQAGALMALYDVRYLITFPPIPGRYPYQDTWQNTQAYALEVLPLEKTPFWEQDGVRAYRVLQPAVPSPFRLDLGAAGTEPYLGGGWDLSAVERPYGATANWVTSGTGDVYLPMAGPAGATLRLRIAPLAYPGAPAQSLSVRINGATVLAGHPLAEGWQEVSVRVPATVTRRGPNQVELAFAWAASPRRVFPDAASRGAIGGTGVVSPVNFDVHSFSQAFISAFTAGGTETKAAVGRRGYNVAVFDPRDGRLLDSRGFDTAANSYEADQMSAYLSGLPRGQIVVLATREDATAHLTPAVVTAIRGLGSRAGAPADLAGQAHALIGVQGAAPGTAAEAIAPGDAFLRLAGDFRTLAAAVDWIELDTGN